MEIKAKLIDFARVPCVMCFENFYMAETCIPNFQSFCPTYLYIQSISKGRRVSIYGNFNADLINRFFVELNHLISCRADCKMYIMHLNQIKSNQNIRSIQYIQDKIKHMLFNRGNIKN